MMNTFLFFCNNPDSHLWNENKLFNNFNILPINKLQKTEGTVNWNKAVQATNFLYFLYKHSFFALLQKQLSRDSWYK